MRNFKDFSNNYPIQKVIRFNLRPIGKTDDKIKEAGILKEDAHRAQSYIIVKDIIDRFHKKMIDRSLKFFKFHENNNQLNSLEEYMTYYLKKNRTPQENEDFKLIAKNLRIAIAKRFTEDGQFSLLFKKELIRDIITEVADNDEEKAAIEEFQGFTTYFTGFHTNRANMYSPEEKSTSIAFRIVNQNLPKFIDNIGIFQALETIPEITDKFPALYEEYKTILNVSTINEIFEIDYYNTVLTQTQIDVYNAVIGKVRTEEKDIKGINQIINEYNQVHSKKGEQIPLMKPLFKQILSDRVAISSRDNEFDEDDDNAVLKEIDKFYQELINTINTGHSLKELLTNIRNYNTERILVSYDTDLNEVCKTVYGSWDFLQRALENDYARKAPIKSIEDVAKFEKRRDKYMKSIDSISLAAIDTLLAQTGKSIVSYFETMCLTDNIGGQKLNIFDKAELAYENIKELLTSPYPNDKKLSQDTNHIILIKSFLDSLKDIQWFIKPLACINSNCDPLFYGEFIYKWEFINNNLNPLYNKVRNYLTRKPYSDKKIKLNFQNSTLLSGWDLNKEVDNTSIILRKEGLYYLAILNPKYNKVFASQDLPCDGDCYEKMVYKLLPGANKMLPKVFFSKSKIDYFNPSEEILSIRESESFKKGSNFNLKDCHKFIDFFKASIEKHEEWRKFGFHFSPTESYDDISGFYREIEEEGYKIDFVPVSASYINRLVEEGKIYLFQIYNKDFSPSSKGTPNLHTLYWKALFSPENIQDTVYKLNGQAEIFYRPASIRLEETTIHSKERAINNKNEERKTIKPTSTFDYDIIKNRRYTQDQYMFHVPITLNFKAQGNGRINEKVNQFIKEGGIKHIIGIDRGERNLLYLTLIDMQGNIVKQESLNTISDKMITTNYHKLLDAKQGDRDAARKNWQTIETIKELKEGYLSLVVHKIAHMMIDYDAAIVIEDLNMGFKNSRKKIEKQVYQKFEKALIDKLNYLIVDKRDPQSIRHALQLTEMVDTLDKIGRQCGFLFYIPAWDTSNIDPVTGFVNFFRWEYENVTASRELFKKFKDIRYNSDKGYYEFTFDYNDFTTKAAETRSQWTACTHGTRIKRYRDESGTHWEQVVVHLTEEFNQLFMDYKIDVKKNLKEAILERDEKAFFERLTYLMRLLFQMRNSISGTDIDYIVSPVADENGHFYESENCGDELPRDADANGAYNIARKGLMLMQQIAQTPNGEMPKLTITNKEWLQFAQK